MNLSEQVKQATFYDTYHNHSIMRYERQIELRYGKNLVGIIGKLMAYVYIVTYYITIQ